MAGRVEKSGMTEFLAGLRAIDSNLGRNATKIVHDTTEGAAADLRAAYPQRNYGSRDNRGNLRRGVKTQYPPSQIVVGQVRNTAPHAQLYEFGTQNRRTLTGANRGSMPPHPTAIAIYERRRRAMNEQLIEIVQAEGFQVTGAI